MKMNKTLVFLSLFTLFSPRAQEAETNEKGHINENKFRQLYDEFATPNKYHNAAGAPGVEYYQQKVDYVMDITLDDKNQRIDGTESIKYTNNSPDALSYLWMQLDQNIRKKDAPALEKNGSGVPPLMEPKNFVKNYMDSPFDGGFNIESVKDSQERPLPFIINMTMMRIDLPTPLQPGQQLIFNVKWWYKVNNHVKDRARSGYEYFEKDDNRAYVIAQFFPRMCVYNDVEGWQNYQFWGNGEFALEFGDYEVDITVPSDHIVEATGTLQNPKEVLTREEYKRFKDAQTSYDKPVFIVTQEEAEIKETQFSEKTSTWKFIAKNVRDFGSVT